MGQWLCGGCGGGDDKNDTVMVNGKFVALSFLLNLQLRLNAFTIYQLLNDQRALLDKKECYSKNMKPNSRLLKKYNKTNFNFVNIKSIGGNWDLTCFKIN